MTASGTLGRSGRTPVAGRPSRARVAALILVLVLTAIATSAPILGPAGEIAAAPAPPVASGSPPPSTGPLRLDLLEQDFSFEIDGTIRLTYRVSGDAATIAELAEPAPPTPDPAADATTTEGTTAAADGSAQPDAAGTDDPTTDEPPPADEVAPTPVTVRVSNYDALGPFDDVTEHVGPDAVAPDLDDAIDGVQYDEARRLIEVGDDGTATMTLAIETDREPSTAERLRFDTPGIHPLWVILLVGDPEAPTAAATAGTVVQLLQDGGVRDPDPLDLAAVAAITDPGPLATDDDRDAADAALGDIAEAAAATVVPLTLAIPPSVLGPATATPTEQDALGEALSDDELLALPAVPFDVSSAAAVDRVDAFGAELIRGEDELTADLPTTPVRRDLWLVTEPLSAAGAQALRERGVRLLVITEDVYRATVGPDLPRTDLFVEVELPDGATMPMIVVDPLGAEMTTPVADAVLGEHTATEWAVATVAELVLDGESDGGLERRSRVIATPDLVAPDPRLLDALAAIAATTPAVRVMTATGLTGVTDTQRTSSGPVTESLPDSAGPDLAPRLERLELTAAAAFNAASMLPEGDPRVAEWAESLETYASPAYPDEYVDRRVEAILEETQMITDSIVPPEPFTFTLTGREGDIDMRIGNTAAEPLTVKLRLSSPKLTFPEGDQLITLRPDDETSVIVPVRARSNGTSAVEVEILTPIDEPLVEPITLTSRVTTLTGLGQVLTGGLVLVLLSWWFSHWRATRRRRIENGDPTPRRGIRRRAEAVTPTPGTAGGE